MSPLSPEAMLFITAELMFLLVRSRDIQILFKTEQSLRPDEKRYVKYGMGRSVLLEAFLFVPASSGLLLLTIGPYLAEYALSMLETKHAYGILGTISYGFPFAAIRKIITAVALKTLKNCVELMPEQQPAENAADLVTANATSA